MMQYALKIVFSTAILIAVAELAKRSSFWAAALASLPLLLRYGLGFWLSLGIACFATATAYFGMIKILGMFGIRI